MEGSVEKNLGVLEGWNSDEIIGIARDVLTTEADGIRHMLEHVDGHFAQAVAWLYATCGRVIVMGIGKSGLIGRKIAATLSSTGTPAIFVHPVEAMHGDLGAVRSKDLILALSNSGETEELNAILPVLRRLKTRIIALTGNTSPTLARLSHVCLYTGVPKEACPLGLAPTASTTAMLAMGDALAVALIKLHDFQAPDFRRTHPGGQLGARLQVPLKAVMRHGDENIPRVHEEASLHEALEEMSGKGLGATLVVDSDGVLTGIFTDGDLRRALNRHSEINGLCVREIMTRSLRSIKADQSVAEAIEMMENHLITVLPVSDDEGRLEGILHLHDLLGKGKIRFTPLSPQEL